MTTASLPYNPISGIQYSGRNIASLKTGEWATFLQWRSAGFSVKKGEHGQPIVKYVSFTKKNKDGKREDASAPRHYTVFERSQVSEL